MSIDIVDISLTLMCMFTGKVTFFNVFPKCLHFEKSTLFHYLRIFCYKQQQYEATDLLGTGCALTYVNVYITHRNDAYSLGNKLLSNNFENNDVLLSTNTIWVVHYK